MTSNMPVIILIAVAVLVIVGLGLWYAMRQRRSQNLREKFGPEYNYTLDKIGDQRAAESTLKDREKRVVKLDIHDLDENRKQSYQEEWVEVQANFVDDPSKSVEDANRLITEVMIARGFPVADFEQRAADLSVLYPDFVSNYRSAYTIALKNQQKTSSTEELRQAMVYYRSLFEELLGIGRFQEVSTPEKENAKL
jgi:hypothetical protein